MLWRWLVIGLVIVWGSGGQVIDTNNVDLSTVDVKKLSTRTYGTDLLLLENTYRDQSTYKFEDFFWTGSGDGPEDESNWDFEENQSTIYKTKTVVTTVFIESSNSSSKTNTTKCSIDCTTSSRVPESEIKPTPTYTNYSDIDSSEEDFFDADRQFWLLTVLKSDGKDPVIVELKNSLAKLYKTAFQRQQEKHLGIRNGRAKRQTNGKLVNVYIHQVNRTDLNTIEVLYHVSLDGKPVSAVIAANDMHLLTDEEVRKELGYPFLIKAEPYLKPSEPQGLSGAKNTWMVIGISIAVFLVFLLTLAFILGCTKKKKRVGTPTSIGVENRQHIFERGVSRDNKGFVGDVKKQSPTYIRYSNDTTRNVTTVSRPGSSISSVSTSSGSLDISPLMTIKKHRRTPPKKPPRPKAALNRTAPMGIRKFPMEVFDSDSSRKDSPDTDFGGNFEPGVVSPKSYLSMPSVKSFPRGSIPEPLNKVLEPVSIHHLDIPDDDFKDQDDEIYKKFGLTRHGSLGAVEDPGVIGPIVWTMHKEKMNHGVSVDEGINDINTSTNLTKMRKRFHDLLDDTFSLFGSRRTSPVEQKRFDATSRATTEIKSHSAVDRSTDDLKAPPPKPRPRTTDPRKVDQPPTGPKGAWSSTAPSPLVRPLSAGIINPYPRVNVDHVLAEGKFSPNDPALSLIATLKSEIERISLPGSTTDLNR
ncbi:uncharacterized protein LOC130445148 [Diorhabda sublineata]|uniref:uncharacterized protein LOC130445148 n=1 Tax=Diorhabda sublineata TaxID=1163346 RepID=UPI0024E08940|nr:uncharacterized protein LOC130445148 [Diorhabda sublineata]